MDINQLQEFISTVGFPIVVTLVFVFRTEKTIKENTKAISELALAIAKMENRGK